MAALNLNQPHWETEGKVKIVDIFEKTHPVSRIGNASALHYLALLVRTCNLKHLCDVTHV